MNRVFYKICDIYFAYPSSFRSLKYNRPRDHGAIFKVVNSIRYSPRIPYSLFLRELL